MDDLTALPHNLDPTRFLCNAVIETPKGSRNKFTYDPESNLFRLAGLLPHGMSFPFDFGFIPSTLGDDGDPVDILVLMDEPAHVGCLVELRLIGVINLKQSQDGKTEQNDRLLGVSVQSYDHEDVKDLSDMSDRSVSEIREFFTSYPRQKGKSVEVTGSGGRSKALEALQTGIRGFDRQHH